MSNDRRPLLFAIIVLALLIITYLPDTLISGNQTISYSEFIDKTKSKEITDVTIKGTKLIGKTNTNEKYTSQSPVLDFNLTDRLLNSGINVSVEDADSFGIGSLIRSLLPMLIFGGILYFFYRQSQGGSGGGGGPLSFARSKAKLITEKNIKITFDDVAGADEAKAELKEIVDFLRNPLKYQKIGAKIPKGALLVGPPGTGKTLLAKAVAGEAKVPFFSISGSDFVEMFVGVGASRVRDMFEQAKKNSPCIIFIDEIDAVGRQRGGMNSHDEREQTLNQLLVEMDGFETNQHVIVIAATNRIDILDKALLRPGRFDRQITVSNPDLTGREAILKVHAGKIAIAKNVNLKIIAKGTPGFSGADLANLCNEAALMAARHSKRLVTLEDFEKAKDRIIMGAEKKTLLMNEQERKLTAYHEAGHAIVGLLVEGNDPLHKVTIIPHGRALGVTVNLPERDQLSVTKKQLEGRLAMIFGGRAAEIIVFGPENVTTGASSDISQATRIAKGMVMAYGMSEKAGRINYIDLDNEKFANISSEMRLNIENEMKTLIQNAEQLAEKVLTDNIDKLHLIANALLERETLSGDETKRLMNGETLADNNQEDTNEPDNKGSDIFDLPSSNPTSL